MENTIIFATNNKNKVAEVKDILKNQIEILSLQEAGITIDIPEPYDTLEENASTKSTTIHHLTKKNCFSEDTGLFVDALNGEPGVKSARYADDAANNEDNIAKLLAKLGDNHNRTARFRTIISMILDEKEYLFEGVCEGRIQYQKTGSQGFGYDAIFIPDGADKSFAEMGMEEKARYSHRKKAINKLVQFLSKQF